MNNRSLIVIAHDLRSNHNVGSLLRTAEALGVQKVYLTGYTPYPAKSHDERLPHIARRVALQISKTALGADSLIPWTQTSDVLKLIRRLKRQGYCIVALEQAESSVDLKSFKAPIKLALILGNEPKGIDRQTLNACDEVVEIPLPGKKESLNVVQAAAIAIYQILNY